MNHSDQHCVTCDGQLTGQYCSSCGEKRVEDKDLSLKELIQQAVGFLFSLNSKFFKSIYYALTKPWKLSE